LGCSRAMRSWLDGHAQRFDVLHSHGLWMWPAKYAADAAQLGGVPLVMSPRGMLEAWCLRRRWLPKRVVWHWWQRRALQQAACIHATSDAEAESIRRVGLGNPVAVVPNGVDSVLLGFQAPDGQAEEAWPELAGRRVLLFLSRIHPVKGLMNLAEAWRRLSPEFPEWVCVVAGPDEGGHLAEVKKAFGDCEDRGRVLFPGPVYGDLKHALMARADVFVLPTFTENFGMVVAESLAVGTPVVTTRGAPWSELDEWQCGWWVDIGIGPLTEALEDALRRTAGDLEAMGERGRRLIERRYTWDRIGAQIVEVYEWLLGRGNQPGCVAGWHQSRKV
jgi:glycosyltransferase involved in cell wall biosynthesis